MKKITIVFLCLILWCYGMIWVYATEDESAYEVLAPVISNQTATETAGTDTAGLIDAKAGLLMELTTGAVILTKNEHQRLYPASVTKIMSLLLVCEAIQEGKLKPEQKITCSESAAQKGGSQIWLEAGEIMTVEELLKASFVYSANDACTLLAEQIAGSEEAFVVLMNEKAQSLGMNDTHFDNCTGLDDDTTEHLTSAYDIALMARELLKIDFVTDYTTIWMDTLRNGETQLVNTNKLIRTYKGITGLKTGTTTKAGCCIAATAERDGLKLVAVILGAEHSTQRFASAKAMLDYGFANYEIFAPTPDISDIGLIPLSLGVEHFVEVKTQNPTPVLLKKGEGKQVTVSKIYEKELTAPIAENALIGKIEYLLNGTVIASTDIESRKNYEALSVSKAILRLFQSISQKNFG